MKKHYDPLPAPMWMRETAAWTGKLLLLTIFTGIAMNVAAGVIEREFQLQQQRPAIYSVK